MFSRITITTTSITISIPPITALPALGIRIASPITKTIAIAITVSKSRRVAVSNIGYSIPYITGIIPITLKMGETAFVFGGGVVGGETCD